MKIAVLGAGGFIGSNMIRYLLETTDHRFCAFDRDLDKLQDVETASPAFAERVSVTEGDLKESGRVVRDLAESCDLVVDLIAYANPSMYVSNPLAVVELNLFDNLKVVEICEEASIPLIQFSTCEVYGVTGGREEPFSDEIGQFILGPVKEHRWIYACAKQLLERMIHAHGLERGLSYTIIRPFNFIGPRIDYLPDPGTRGGPRVFSHFLSALIHGGPLHLVDGGTARRSYTYIDDAMAAFKLVLENVRGACRNQIVNVGNPDNETTIRGLAELMKELWADLTGKPSASRLIPMAGTEFYGDGYADCDRRVPDVTKLRALGWQPRFSLRDTVAKSMEYYLDRLGLLAKTRRTGAGPQGDDTR